MDVENLDDLDGNPPLQTGPNGAGTKEIAEEGEAFIHLEDEAEAPNKGKRGPEQRGLTLGSPGTGSRNQRPEQSEKKARVSYLLAGGSLRIGRVLC